MPASLRVLVVEDSDNDTHLMLDELRRNGYTVEHERVETRAAMQAALARGGWDLVLCDYTMPQFSAMQALQTLQESGLDIPFIVISGTVGEETAVTTLKAGAHDFILKGKFARLLPAIQRELRDAQTRASHRKAEEERKQLITRLEAINAEIERFTYTAFHDLRAPLVTIKGFLGMLEKDLAENKPENVQKDLGRIAGAANKMDELLSDLLELFRVGRVARPSEEVDLYRLTLTAVRSLQQLLEAKNATVKVSEDLPTVYGERMRLGEVLENLIENAAKHAGEQEHLVIEVGTQTTEEEQIIFVRDNGPGIDPRYHNRIFNLFEKLHPERDGTGIGLALVKRIIEVQGGRIWVESDGEGHGSTFYVALPRNRGR